MKSRYLIINHNKKAYQKSTKKLKTRMLDELSEILHLNRQYISSLLRNIGNPIIRNGKVVVVADITSNELSRRGRKKVYGKEILTLLKKIWPLTGFASSKHVVAFIKFNSDIIFNHVKLKYYLNEDTKQLLLTISASTVDRLLKPYRDQLKLKNRYKTNPFSSNLKKSIKVESWFDKVKEPGYVEIDLVHHSGSSGKGEFLYTLTATEIVTGWTELRALKNKAMIWTEKALQDIVKTIPVTVRKLHSDNGSEFINAHVQRFCKENEILFTRSRPYKKNDAPYVESKNWSMVRAYVGWCRYDTEEELTVLDRLLRLITIRHNLFMPHMKLLSRNRQNGKIIKHYEMNTCLNRVLMIPDVKSSIKQRLIKLRHTIDIIKLTEEIQITTEALSNAYDKKYRRLNNV